MGAPLPVESLTVRRRREPPLSSAKRRVKNFAEVEIELK